MLFGSQFLREVYASDTSMSTVIEKAGARMMTAPVHNEDQLTSMIMNSRVKYTEGANNSNAKNSTVAPPQVRQAEMGRKVKQSQIDLTASRHKILDTSTNRHQ